MLPERSTDTSEMPQLVVEKDLEFDPRELPEWLREFAHEQGRALAGEATESMPPTPTWLAATRGELPPDRLGEEPAALAAARDARASDSDVLQLIDERDLPEWLRELEIETPAAPEPPATPVQERRRLPSPAVARAWYASESIRAEPDATSAFEGLAPALGRVVLQAATVPPERASASRPSRVAAQRASANWLRRVLLILVLVVIALLVVYVAVLSR
jgi:hypothetical protein